MVGFVKRAQKSTDHRPPSRKILIFQSRKRLSRLSRRITPSKLRLTPKTRVPRKAYETTTPVGDACISTPDICTVTIFEYQSLGRWQRCAPPPKSPCILGSTCKGVKFLKRRYTGFSRFPAPASFFSYSFYPFDSLALLYIPT